MLYRSPLTRWVLIVTGLTAGLLLMFGSEQKWRSAPSLHWLAQAGIPLQWWGGAVVLYALLLVHADARPLGYAIGCFLYAMFTIALFVTLDIGGDAPKNVIGIAAMIDTTVFHALSIRTAWAYRLAQP